MLESFRKGQRWLTLIFVSVIGLVFVFFFGSGGAGFGPATPTGGAIVQLDEIQLTSRDFAREKQNAENRLRQQLGDAYDQIGGDRYVDSQALSTLINSVVLSAAAEDAGLHVTTDEVRRVVQTVPAFIDADGRFSPAAFKNFAEREYGTQRVFVRTFTRSLLGQKLVQVLTAQTAVSDAEIDLQTRYELDEVRIAYVALDGSQLPEAEQPTDEEVEAYAEAHEDELRETFNQRFESLATPERVRARHLLVQVAPDATPEEVEQARERAAAALARISEGEDFAEVVADVSEDAGSADSGGDLGFFGRGENDPALDEAAFSLELGVVSEIIRSDFGFHIVRVEERKPAAEANFEESRIVLAREAAAAERAREWAATRSRELSEAIADGASLEEAAQLAGVTIERPPALKRRPDGFVAGLGAAEELLTTAFTLNEGESSPQIFDVADRQVLIQVIERNFADPETVAAARADRRERMLAEKQNRILEAWVADYRRQLEKSGRLRINAELALGSS